MAEANCWACSSDEVAMDRSNCPMCGAPQSEFIPNVGDSFLSSESISYIDAIEKGKIAYPQDSQIDDGLQASLNKQLVADLMGCYMELGAIAKVEPDILFSVLDHDLDVLGSYETVNMDIETSGRRGFITFVSELLDALPGDLRGTIEDAEAELGES